MDHKEILRFWFDELKPQQWWVKDHELDLAIMHRFTAIHAQAAAGELFQWRQSAEGRLSEIIILDQFSRNMFRNTVKAFAYDALALVLAQEAILSGADLLLKPEIRSFLYMPFMHSESLAIHEQAVELFSDPDMINNYEFELKHKTIIDQFGRYPHRNKILGRESSAAELTFLNQPDSSF